MIHIIESGRMIEEEQAKSLVVLTALAKINLPLPSTRLDNGLVAYNKRNDKSGNDFNTSYADQMASGHKEAMAFFEMGSADCTYQDINAWTAATLPALNAHIDQTMMFQKGYNKM